MSQHLIRALSLLMCFSLSVCGGGGGGGAELSGVMREQHQLNNDLVQMTQQLLLDIQLANSSYERGDFETGDKLWEGDLGRGIDDFQKTYEKMEANEINIQNRLASRRGGIVQQPFIFTASGWALATVGVGLWGAY